MSMDYREAVAEAPGGQGRPTLVVARWARTHLAVWIVAATAVDAALVVLFTVLITLPGQSDAARSGLILGLLVLLFLSIAFPVAGHILERQQRAAEQARCG